MLAITINGAVGDLLPIMSIPGQMGQHPTYLLPPGSIVAQRAQSATNVINVVDNITFGAGLHVDLAMLLDAKRAVTLGVPLAMGLQFAGVPVAFRWS